MAPAQTGAILSAGYLGQLLGAVVFGARAERFGRLPILFVPTDISCPFAWNATSMISLRFVQGIGTGGEVPVASAYINECIGAKKRGRFFLLYEVMFLFGLLGAVLIGYELVPVFGWKGMFAVGLVPAVLLIPLRLFMSDSPRWLASRGRYAEADRIIARLERSVTERGGVLAMPVAGPMRMAAPQGSWRELFGPIYRKRAFMIWALWFCSYFLGNGTITWLPTLYQEAFHLPLQTSLGYGFLTSLAGVVAAVICALAIDRVGSGRWYAAAFTLGILPLLALFVLGPAPRPRSSCSPGSPTLSCKRSPSRSTSTPPSFTRPGCAQSAPGSATPGCGWAPRSARRWWDG